MRINFFEEFPSEDVLALARYMESGALLYIAAPGMERFKVWVEIAKRYNDAIDFAYWPVLRRRDGYWFSPFANIEAMQKSCQEIKKEGKDLKILWDAEIPILRPGLILKGIPKFKRNKRLMLDMAEELSRSGVKIHTAEYPWPRGIMSLVGKIAAHPSKVEKRIGMYYSSLIKARDPHVWFSIYQEWIEKGNPWGVALGLIDTGILGVERLLSPDELRHDLELVRQYGFEEVTIFRLSGLKNKAYREILYEKSDWLSKTPKGRKE